MRLPPHGGKGKRHRNRKGKLSESEIMTILVCYHLGTYRNFKEYYTNCVRGLLKRELPDAVSYNRFVMNICSALTAYRFFDNKPEALPVSVVKNRQLEVF